MGLEAIFGIPSTEDGSIGSRKAYDSLRPELRNNYLHIFGHGGRNLMCVSPDGIQQGCMTKKGFLEWIKKQKEYKRNPRRPIVLWGCFTGMNENGIAAFLANKLGVQVIAPDNLAWWTSNGFEGIYGGLGEPGQKRLDTSRPGRMRKYFL